MIDILFTIFVVLDFIWCGTMTMIIIMEYYKTKKK